MKFEVLTLFPEMFEPIKHSIVDRATEKKLIEINLINIRDFSDDKHNHVDDTPYGGGAGMVMKPDVVCRAFDSLEKEEKSKVIYLSPQGKKLNQSKVKELAKEDQLILICGHYEGIDQRAIEKIVDEEISIGDYVLTGGELPAMVLIDSVSRYVEGVLSEDSTKEESFSSSNNLLEYPQYTRPYEFDNKKVPDILLSGNHQEIERWRKEQSLIITYKKRKDLLDENQIKQAESLIKKYNQENM